MKKAPLNLYDNTTASLEKCGIDSASVESVYNDLSFLANKNIADFDKKDLFLFTKKSKDQIEKLSICTLQPVKLNSSAEDLLKINVTCGNLMGFIKVNNTQINIKSRFCNSENDDLFFQYMLKKIFHLNIVSFKHSIEKNDLFELYIYLFSFMLKKAMRKGIFRLYKTFHYNNSSIKGCIDIARFIKLDIPFVGNTATSVRQFSYDNNITQLIRHTIEYISSKKNYSFLLSADAEIKQLVRLVRELTPSYDRKKRLNIIKVNKKKFSHPFFSEYADLQKLCLLILRKEKVSYTESDKNLYGVLFDGSWVWEEYLAAIFNEYKLGLIHSENKNSNYGINIYPGNTCYPDFYKCVSRSPLDKMNNCVLDAKYQELEGFKRDGLHQLITYMHILPANNGALIHPLKENLEDSPCSISKPGFSTYCEKENLYGLGGNACIVHFPVPAYLNDYSEFSKAMREKESELAAIVRKFLLGF